MDNKVGMKIKTLTLMRKLTTWATKEVSEIITLDIRGIILEIHVETTQRWSTKQIASKLAEQRWV